MVKIFFKDDDEEFDKETAAQIIRLYYQKILKRESDDEGLNHYLAQIEMGEISFSELQRILKNSDEYKMLNSKLSEKRKTKENFLANLKEGQELRVVFGDHWSNHDGWLVLDEDEQDITKPLDFADESVDVIFTEHVLEHISFSDAISFLQEAKRILKSGGVLRIVCPGLEKLMSLDLKDERFKIFFENSITRYWVKENDILQQLGSDGVIEEPKTFLFNSEFMLYGHKFIWSKELLKKVLYAIKFSHVNLVDVGQGTKPEYCIERRHRGLYLGNDWKEDLLWNNKDSVFDVESLHIEAIK